MNYHNFSSRLSTQRLPASAAKEISKPAPKKSGRGAGSTTPRRK
jgi:hypothetical protein